MFVGIYEVVRSGEKRSLIVVASSIKEKDQQSEQKETCQVDIAGKSGNASFPRFSVTSCSTDTRWILSGLDVEIKRNPAFLFPSYSLCISGFELSAKMSEKLARLSTSNIQKQSQFLPVRLIHGFSLLD